MGFLSLCTLSAVPTRQNAQEAAKPIFSASIVASIHAVAGENLERLPDTTEYRVARRLQARLTRDWNIAFPLERIVEASAGRRSLLSRSTTVSITSKDSSVVRSVVFPLSQHAHWVRLDVYGRSLEFLPDEKQIALSLADEPLGDFPHAENATILSLEENNGLMRVKTEGVAKTGYQLDRADLGKRIARALKDQELIVALQVEQVPGKIINGTDTDFGNLELLATGKSNFAGSAHGRKENIKKGLRERMNNVLIPPGAKFSFNKNLGSMSSGGWYMGLGIFNGEDLRPVLGGGICQVATTVYRAAVMAGLPIMQKANHSLFVTYYEKDGLGLDATIFPGQQDLTFTNDTPHYMLMQSYADGDDAFVNLYGTKDGRTVELSGPYLNVNAPADLVIDDRSIRINEIAWKQRIVATDGLVTDNVLVSKYKAIPKRLKKEYAITNP